MLSTTQAILVIVNGLLLLPMCALVINKREQLRRQLEEQRKAAEQVETIEFPYYTADKELLELLKAGKIEQDFSKFGCIAALNIYDYLAEKSLDIRSKDSVIGERDVIVFYLSTKFFYVLKNELSHRLKVIKITELYSSTYQIKIVLK